MITGVPSGFIIYKTNHFKGEKKKKTKEENDTGILNLQSPHHPIRSQISFKGMFVALTHIEEVS